MFFWILSTHFFSSLDSCILLQKHVLRKIKLSFFLPFHLIEIAPSVPVPGTDFTSVVPKHYPVRNVYSPEHTQPQGEWYFCLQSVEGGSYLQTKHHFLISYELTNLEGKGYMGIKRVTWKVGGKGMVNFGV